MNNGFLATPVAEPLGSGTFCPLGNNLIDLQKVVGLDARELIALQGSHSIGGVIRCAGLGNVADGPFCPSDCVDDPNTYDWTGLDGSSFDETPGKLDNLYYKQLVAQIWDELPPCNGLANMYPALG